MQTTVYEHLKILFDKEAAHLEKLLGEGVRPDILEKMLLPWLGVERTARAALGVDPGLDYSRLVEFLVKLPDTVKRVAPLWPQGQAVTADVTLYDIPARLLTKLVALIHEDIFEGQENVAGRALCKNEEGLVTSVIAIEDGAFVYNPQEAA